MGELFEVREYETIIGNKDYKTQYRYLKKDVFEDLIEFIHAFDAEEEESDVLDFIKVGYKRNIGETVTFKNYVGLIQMKNNFQIQILPKIDFANSEKDQTKQVFMKMLRSMKDFPSKVFSNANLKMDRMNLYEIFINMYLQETRQLVKRGLKSSYVDVEENLTFYKGKLLVSQHIRQNMFHKERFYVGYDEYQVNRAENKLIKSTLMK
ncbi:MAG: restriction endonuclease, partial [Lachnospiraceae bacterium]|nr:restriction endonuclease [Lachnospiraceae bacterium]